MNAVGNNIKKLRKQQNLSQEALAEKLNITRQAVSQWENGNTQPDIDTLERIAKVFGVDILEVIYGEKRKAVSRLTLQQKKRYWIGFIGFGVLALIEIAILILFYPSKVFDLDLQEFSSYAIMYEDLLFYIQPMMYISILIALLFGASLIWDIRIHQRSIRNVILIAALACISFYYGAGVIYHGGGLPELVYSFELFAHNNPAIFILPGIGLFLGLNGRRTEIKKTEKA